MPEPNCIVVDVAGGLTPSMEHVRKTSICEQDDLSLARDKFDSQSRHVIASIGGAIAGMVRLTAAPLSVLKAWAVDPDHVPDFEGGVELTRACVDIRFRGLGLYKLRMTEALVEASGMSATAATAVIEPDFRARSFLYRLGFEDVGRPVTALYPEKGIVLGQYIRHSLGEKIDQVLDVRETIIERMRNKGFRVESRALHRVLP